MIEMAKQATLHITEIIGKSCRDKIEKTLSGVPGVSAAKVNVATETATVDYDPSLASEADLIKAVETAGYGVITLPYREIPAGEAKALLETGDYVVVDLRQKERCEREHLKGAINILLRDIMMDDTLELPKDRGIMFVCEDGTDSMVACEMLMARGYPPQNLFSVADGMIGCRKVGCPMEYAAPSARQQPV